MKRTKSRLVAAVEAFLKLRTSIFPEVRGAAECSALEELEQALRESGGKVPYDTEGAETLKEFLKRGLELEKEHPFPGTIGRWPKK